MKHHHLASFWPLMTGSAFEELKADIATNGLHMPVLTYKGEVLDGRNRERACKEASVPVRYEEAKVHSDAEAFALVVSLNQHRRHLSVEERAFLGATLATMKTGTRTDLMHRNSMSVRDAANVVKVSPSSIANARAILAHGTQEDKEAVLRGKARLRNKAAELRQRNRAAPGPAPKLIIANPGPLRSLTRQEVDPEFTGTDTDWVDKYGHVQVMTAAEYASMRFDAWASNMKTLSNQTRNLPDWPTVDHNWLRNPRPAAVAKMAEALESLRPKIAEAEALLQRAEQAIKHPTKAARAAAQ
jgi:hypothetical protein